MKKALIFLFIVGIAILVLVLWQIFGPTVKNPENRFLYIPTGSTYAQVKDSLRKNEMVDGFFWFDKIASYASYPKNIKPGKYKIKKETSIYNLLKMLRVGNQVPINLVLTKLRTKEDLAEKIDQKFEIGFEKAMHFLNNNQALKEFNVDTNNVLTAVIPNTYRYLWTASMQDIISLLYKEEKKFWDEERLQKAKKLQLSPKEVYILASIVEEETNKLEDKGKIASVYINRMKRGMKLAADPTVKFAMKNFGLKRIYHKHLKFESPFNTYLNAGLPPGPICTPSIKTIDAVLNAPQTDYLFFVAKADFSGYSNFATNYNQHLIYARAYQKALDSLMKEKKESSDKNS